MEVYLGTNQIIKEPKIIVDKYTKDFGVGFYCTKLKTQAEKWARKFATPIVNIYEYSELGNLEVKVFDKMTDEWLDFIVSCRAGIPHSYDIVIGPMADDQVYNYVADYMAGIITREAFWALAKFKYPTHQITFCTEKALSSLQYINNYEVK